MYLARYDYTLSNTTFVILKCYHVFICMIAQYCIVLCYYVVLLLLLFLLLLFLLQSAENLSALYQYHEMQQDRECEKHIICYPNCTLYCNLVLGYSNR